MQKSLLVAAIWLIDLPLFVKGPRVSSSALGSFSEIANPAPAGSLAPSLSAAAGGETILSWLEPDGEEYALRFAARGKQGWSVLRTVVGRPDFDAYARGTSERAETRRRIDPRGVGAKTQRRWQVARKLLYVAASHDGGKELVVSSENPFRSQQLRTQFQFDRGEGTRSSDDP
jgi:hypothetical protein